MRTESFHRSLIVDRPASAAWQVLADYRYDPMWRTGVRTMNQQPPGLVTVGTTTLEILRFAGRTYRIPGEVIAVEPEQSIQWAASKATGGRYVDTIDDTSCRIRLELNIQIRGFERLLAPLLIRMMNRTLDTDIDRLASLLHANTPDPTPTAGGRVGVEFERRSRLESARRSRQTTLSTTSMLLRVAFEYGHTSWARATAS